MQHLIIDGNDLGPVIGYRQNRELERWSFLMESGYYIGVDFSSIKLFTVQDKELQIILYKKG